MIYSREYVAYLAKQTVKQLMETHIIKTDKVQMVNERVAAALQEELQL